jgi:hypothetical protein
MTSQAMALFDAIGSGFEQLSRSGTIQLALLGKEFPTIAVLGNGFNSAIEVV